MNPYKTEFKGDIDLGFLDPISVDAIRLYVHSTLKEGACVDVTSKILYFSGSISNSDERVERLLYELAIQAPLDIEYIIRAQGEDPEDKWDLIIKSSSLYIRRYTLVPEKDEIYVPS